MKVIKYIIGVLLLLGSITTWAQDKDAIMGKWLNQDASAHITIFQQGGKYQGRIVWLKEMKDERGNPKMDKNNPVVAMRRRPIIGTEILKGFSYSGDNVWEGGTIYDPRTGKTYSCKITLANANKLDVRGFVGFSMLGRTESWSRVR